MAQSRIQEEAAVAVTSMALQATRDTGENIARIMDSAEMITDPSRGNFLDLTM